MNPTRWRRIAWKTWLWAAGMLLVLPVAGGARAEAPKEAAPERALWIRRIEEGRDGPALRRLEVVRRALPEKFRRRRNFAWAVAAVDGLEKVEYFAHSGVDRRGEVSSGAKGVEGISVRPKKGRFEVLCVNQDDEVEGEDCYSRYPDTEYKIIEDLASRLPDPSARGRVRIYTDLYPCASCRHVMRQFVGAYTNIQLQILYRDR